MLPATIIPPAERLTLRSLADILPRLAAIRRDLLRDVKRNNFSTHLLETVQNIIFRRAEPLITESLSNSLFASWIAGTSKVAKPVPVWEMPPAPLRKLGTEPVLARYPQLEKSLQALREKRIVDQRTYNLLSSEAKSTAFTIARAGSLETVSKIRDAIADDISEGGTLRDFRTRISTAIEGSRISPAHVETIYRTQIGQAYAVGQLSALQHPLIGDAFPYCLWSATHDSRTRPDHLAMEKHGPGGTAIYRSDDPMWMTLFPPAAWSCRCIAIPLSLRDAAAYGSEEAKEWLRTGIPPTSPLYASTPYPLKVPPNWPTHARIQPCGIAA